jgi:hypothetical protein
MEVSRGFVKGHSFKPINAPHPRRLGDECGNSVRNVSKLLLAEGAHFSLFGMLV